MCSYGPARNATSSWPMTNQSIVPSVERRTSKTESTIGGGSVSYERAEGPRPGGDRGAAARRGMEPEGRGQEAPDVRLASGGLRRVRGVAVREGHARAGALRQRLRDGGLPEDSPAFRRLPDAPELSDQEGGGRSVKSICEKAISVPPDSGTRTIPTLGMADVETRLAPEGKDRVRIPARLRKERADPSSGLRGKSTSAIHCHPAYQFSVQEVSK